jgi:hypothetical protein
MFQPIFFILLQRHVSKLLVYMSLFDLLYKEPQVYVNTSQFSVFARVSFNSVNISFSFKYDTKWPYISYKVSNLD